MPQPAPADYINNLPREHQPQPEPLIGNYGDIFDSWYPHASQYAKQAASALSFALLDRFNQGTSQEPYYSEAAYSYTMDQYVKDVVDLARYIEAQDRHLGKLAQVEKGQTPAKSKPTPASQHARQIK